MSKNGIDQIKRHEALRLKPYLCTAGKLTIGFGRNLDDRGITEAGAEYLLSNDIEDFIKAVNGRWHWVEKLDEPRAWVMYNMAFNMGVVRLSGFKKFLSAVEAGDWVLAGKEMEDSDWFKQVGTRAVELQKQMITGEFAFIGKM